MKKMLIVGVLVCLTSLTAPVLAQEIGIEDSAKFMEALAQQVKALLKADNTLGTPIEFEGTTVIPIISYGFGFGAGSGSGSGEEQKAEGFGAGGGAGGGVMPVSFLVMTKDGEIKVISARKGVLGDLMKAVSPMIMEAIKSGQQQQQQPQQQPPQGPPPPPEAEEESSEEQ